MNEYLMIAHEVEKVRLASQRRKSHPRKKPFSLGPRYSQRANASDSEPGGNVVSIETSKIVIGPNEGTHLSVLDIIHKVGAGDSGVSLTIEEWGLPPGQMIPSHTHAREDECSFVPEGELTCYVGGEVVVAPAGSYMIKPRGVPHAFHNAGPETARVMEIPTPGSSFEGYFDEYEKIAARYASGESGEEEHRRARTGLGERYGITWHDERILEVEARFGIRP